MNLKSGYPYWLIKDGLPFNYPKLNKNIKTDVAIIGGGISGALTAYYLIKAGFNCVVVDSRTIGLGSTCASTSLLQYELDTPLSLLSEKIGFQNAKRVYMLCHEAIDELDALTKKIGFDKFNRTKSLYYAAYKKHTKQLKREFNFREKSGLAVEWLTEKDIENNYGFQAPAAILSQQAACTDAYAFTHALHQYNSGKGLEVYDRTLITGIHPHNKKVELITQEGYKILANNIVNATGYEATKYLDSGLVKLHSTYAIVSEHMSDRPLWKDRAVMWNTDEPYLYLRLTDENRIIIGGRDESFYNPVRRDKLVNKKSKQLAKDFSTLFPSIPFIPEFSWTGTFAVTKDSLPYIGNYKKIAHIYFALGFGGNGIVFSLIAATIIRDLLLKKKNKDFPLFSFDR